MKKKSIILYRQTNDCSVNSRICHCEEVRSIDEAIQKENFSAFQPFSRSAKVAFSLAELMIVMLVLTIILAATMPILSKRAKVKAAAVSHSSSNTLTCAKTITSSLTNVTLDPTIMFFYYQMYGGGGAFGGGGGSSAILIDNTVAAIAKGGDGGNGQNVSPSPGDSAVGTLMLAPKGHTLTVYAGGGGGGRGGISNDCNGGGGAGWYGGAGACGTGSGGGANAGGSAGLASSTFPLMAGTQFNGGRGVDSTTNTYGAFGGATSSGGNGSLYGGGGGGGYGGKGGDGCHNSTIPYNNTCQGDTGQQASSTTPGTGKAGTIYGFNYTDYAYQHQYNTYGAGGEGGSVMIFFVTTASSCPNW